MSENRFFMYLQTFFLELRWLTSKPPNHIQPRCNNWISLAINMWLYLFTHWLVRINSGKNRPKVITFSLLTIQTVSCFNPLVCNRSSSSSPTIWNISYCVSRWSPWPEPHRHLVTKTKTKVAPHCVCIRFMRQHHGICSKTCTCIITRSDTFTMPMVYDSIEL